MLLLGQNPWTAIAHVACWKAGFVSVPVSTLFAADAIAYRLNHVGIRVVITDLANLGKLLQARKLATGDRAHLPHRRPRTRSRVAA